MLGLDSSPPRSYRLLLHDTDAERGGLIALRARAGGHVVALETGMEGVQQRLETERWDAIALEILAGPVPAPLAVRDLGLVLRRLGQPMPPAVIYVRDGLRSRHDTIDRLLDEAVPGLEIVYTEEPERVVRALERIASGRRPAAIAIRPDRRPPVIVAEAAEAAGISVDQARAATPAPGASSASNWRR